MLKPLIVIWICPRFIISITASAMVFMGITGMLRAALPSALSQLSGHFIWDKSHRDQRESYLQSPGLDTDKSSSHLNNLDIRKAVKECLQVNAIQNNPVIINMTIGLEINDCFFLSKKKKMSRSYNIPYQYYTKCHFIKTPMENTYFSCPIFQHTFRWGNMLAWSPIKKVFGM